MTPDKAMDEQEPMALPYIVEYARKDGGHGWKPMAAFDLETVAERYAADCANETWEYRVVAAHIAKPVAQEGMVKMHALVDQLAARFKGYLPWPDELRDPIVRGHEMFIEDTIKKSDAMLNASETAACDCCDGKGWYATGSVDKPMQAQCQNCYGTGKIPAPVVRKAVFMEKLGEALRTWGFNDSDVATIRAELTGLLSASKEKT